MNGRVNCTRERRLRTGGGLEKWEREEKDEKQMKIISTVHR